MRSDYFYLIIAIVGEVTATAALKSAGDLRSPGPVVCVVIGYAAALFFLSLTLRTVPVGIAYAIWAGAGTALIALSAYLVYGQELDGMAMLGIAMIVLGVALVNGSTSSVLR